MFWFSFHETATLALVVVFAFLLGLIFGRILRAVFLKRERSDAVKRSQSVILWGVYEKILPFLPGFPYSPKDMVFIGKGFDYLVLDGLAETGNVREIVFLEVKTGTSKLNGNERAVKDAVCSQRISWKEYRPDAKRP